MRLEGQNGRFEVAGRLYDGVYFEKYVEPYLLVTGNCGDGQLQENYYLPCTNGDKFKDIVVVLDGVDDTLVCD
ncbi:hypothetical protein AAVH_40775 [Aphelenchoides avenae]|nr:hypothetical protein AAVH_40775 [Aphelenchus avenae]